VIEQAELPVRPAPFAEASEWLRSRAWIAGWWLAGRSVVLGTALVVHAVGSYGVQRQIGRAHALGVLESWDGKWYRLVASDGYLLVPGRQSDPAFFPLYPLLLRAGHALGVSYATAGIVLSNVAFLVALVAVHALTRELFGEGFAHRAAVYLAIVPFGYVFSMDYPESVVLAAIALAPLAALRRRWALAGVLAAAAALARPEGVFLAFPLLAIAAQQRRALTPSGRGLALGAIVAPGAALASYPLYLDRALHDPLAWSRAERAWGRRFSPLGFVRAFTHLERAFAGNAWVARDVVAFLLYLGLLVVAAKAGAPRSWLVAGAAVVVLPLFSGDFASIGRFGLLAPATLWGLAALGRNRRFDLAFRAGSVALLVAAVATVPFTFP
jgi:dolichyl-phosphate-mannose-protein mannosyltransferase